MSAIASQAAMRFQVPSVGPVRQFLRSIEPPTSPRPSYGSQRGDWGRIAKARVSQAAIYFPGMGFILGWPYLAKELCDGAL